jgi:hypothetical protein
MDAIELPKEVTITAWYTQKFLLVKDQKDITWFDLEKLTMENHNFVL